jgi:hypothetical protein
MITDYRQHRVIGNTLFRVQSTILRDISRTQGVPEIAYGGGGQQITPKEPPLQPPPFGLLGGQDLFPAA